MLKLATVSVVALGLLATPAFAVPAHHTARHQAAASPTTTHVQKKTVAAHHRSHKSLKHHSVKSVKSHGLKSAKSHNLKSVKSAHKPLASKAAPAKSVTAKTPALAAKPVGTNL